MTHFTEPAGFQLCVAGRLLNSKHFDDDKTSSLPIRNLFSQTLSALCGSGFWKLDSNRHIETPKARQMRGLKKDKKRHTDEDL